MRHTGIRLYRDVLFDAAKNQDSSQRIRHHFPVLGAWLAPGLWLFLVLSDSSPTSRGLLILAVVLLRTARPLPSAESADLFAGVAARMGVGSAMAGRRNDRHGGRGWRWRRFDCGRRGGRGPRRFVNHRAPQDPSCQHEQRDHGGRHDNDAAAGDDRTRFGCCQRGLGDQT
jgi:hypothetical protein